jgi:predicted ester cyclase
MEIPEYEQSWVAALNRGDAAAAHGIFAPHCMIHMNGGHKTDLNVTEFVGLVSALLSAFPGLQFRIEDAAVARDKVAFRWIAEGTHSGAFGPLAATGRRVVVNRLILDHVSAGKVTERWEIWDQAGLMQQLGVG